MTDGDYSPSPGTIYPTLSLLQDEGAIAEAAGDDARTVADVFKRCGRRPQCGKCLPDVARMIEDARDLQNSSYTVAAE